MSDWTIRYDEKGEPLSIKGPHTRGEEILLTHPLDGLTIRVSQLRELLMQARAEGAARERTRCAEEIERAAVQRFARELIDKIKALDIGDDDRRLSLEAWWLAGRDAAIEIVRARLAGLDAEGVEK